MITAGGRRLWVSTCHSGENFSLVDTWCFNPGVFLSHRLEVPAIMMESRFRSSGGDAMFWVVFLVFCREGQCVRNDKLLGSNKKEYLFL